MQILFALSPFPVYYAVKQILKKGERPFIFRRNRRALIGISNNHYYLFTSGEYKSKIVLSTIDLLHLCLSVSILVLFFRDYSAIRVSCAPEHPVLFVVLPVYAFLGSLTSVRLLLLLYLFVYSPYKAYKR